MLEENIGSRLNKALESIYGDKNNKEVSTKYNITSQSVGQLKKKKAINETISFICEKENINLNWIQTGKGEMFLKDEDISISSSNNHGYEIDVLNVKAAAGDGIYNYEIEVIDKIVLDKAFFRTAPDIKRIKIIEVDGDSMYPTLQSGDHVIIDETKTNGVDGIYAIQLHNQILIKRLQFNLDGTIDIKSDNIKYDTKAYNPNDTQVPLQVLGMKTLTIQR